MATQAGSARRMIRRRRGWSLALLLSAALHLIVLGWFGLKRAVGAWETDAPPIDVQLVRLTPAERPKARAASRPATGHPSRVPADLIAPASAATRDDVTAGTSVAPGLAIDPPWRVDRKGPVPAPRREPDYEALQPCDPLKDPRREGKACRKVDEIAESVSRFYDPQRGKTADAREARRNEAMRGYRDAPGAAGYPGFHCAVLHRC